MDNLSLQEIWCDYSTSDDWTTKKESFKEWIKAKLKECKKARKPAFIYRGTRYDTPYKILDSGELADFCRKWHISISDDLRSVDSYLLVAKTS